MRISWWNKIPVPRFGAAELFAGNAQYDTAELPGSQKPPVFELPAGSIRKGVDGKAIEMVNPVKKKDGDSGTKENVHETSPFGLSLSKMSPVDTSDDTSPCSPTRNATSAIFGDQLTQGGDISPPMRNTFPRIRPPSREPPGGPEPRASTAMLGDTSPIQTHTPETRETREAKETREMAEAIRQSTAIPSPDDLAALVGVIAPPPKTKTPPPRTGSRWVYR